MNNQTIDKLQLLDVKEIVKQHCTSSLGKALIDKLKPSGNIKIVKRRLNENIEAKKVLESSNHIPLEGLSNINGILDNVDKGMILDPVELLKIGDFLRGSRKIKKFMLDKEFYAPTLSSYALNITECRDIEAEIERCIKNNRVDILASNELKKISRSIDIAEGKIREKLNKFLTSNNNKKYIQDFVISKREDRYVIPIKASYKNEVNGIVLGTSAKGSTVFVEPRSVTRYSTELIKLKGDEAIEIYRILGILTDLIYNMISNVKQNADIIAEYDMVFAKAKFSQNIKGITPKINKSGYIKIVNGKHPLLQGKVVPLNIEVGKSFKGLLITGPNAGGKTVTLKTVGLLTLMVQCGFDICADESSLINVFDDIFVDIGDNQSIENALSTFSSHIKNVAEILKDTNRSSLILLDEIGSGTEPNEGAALAIAILEELYRKGGVVIASTHYGELKEFAKLHPDFENAGMMFDKMTLKPLYKLTLGTSEDSNALFISKQMGIKDSVLNRAKKYIDGDSYNYQTIKKRNEDDEIVPYETQVVDFSDIPEYKRGDRVRLLDQDDYGLVYNPIDKFGNVMVLYKDEYIEVHVKRIELYLTVDELYPEGYNIDDLFRNWTERKLEHDMNRGSKKALKKIQREMRDNRKVREISN